MNDDIKFNLTSDMKDKLLKYNNLKNELNNNYFKYNKNEIQEIKKELDNYRNEFIKLFRKNNKEEISNYLKEKEN